MNKVGDGIAEEVSTRFEKVEEYLQKLNGDYDAGKADLLDTELMNAGAILKIGQKDISPEEYRGLSGQLRDYEDRLSKIRNNNNRHSTYPRI